VARILLGVSGGIAAYRAIELARLATKADHALRVLMTPAAERFVGRASFEGIIGAPVLVDEFERDPLRGTFPGEPAPDHDPIGHLELAARADAFLVAPASANTVAKLAAGICDSLLATTFLACQAPRAVAPAMNDRMYRDAATQANLTTLRDRGVRVIEPDQGPLASRGEHGIGRLPAPDRLLAEVEALLPRAPGPWDGLRVLVTAGGTREPIDAVRFIGNRSSGRMGLALAAAAAERGGEVTVVAANVGLPAPQSARRVDVETTAELAATLAAEFPSHDVLLMAAAVADFRPATATGGKLARDAGEGLELRLEATDDVVAAAARGRRPGQTIVGFAAEHGPEAIDRAAEKLERKGLDAVVYNDIARPGIGFDSDRNEVVIIEPGGRHQVPEASKEVVAEAILDRVAAIRKSAPGAPQSADSESSDELRTAD
jgi:phosphopantothenoylcysteine decarboxylase / phosphopantothenate---cysteine ligase